MPLNPFEPSQDAQEDPLQPFLVSGPYAPIPTLGDKGGIFGPVLSMDLLNTQLASQPITASAIPPIIINTTVQNGTIQLNMGSEAFPSLNFYGDLDNGIYYIGSDHWGLVAGGTKVLDITTAAITHTVPLIPSTATGNTLGDATHRWDIFARNIDASVLIIPTATGADLGDATHRWDLFAQDINASTSINLNTLTASRLVASDASKNLVSTDASAFIAGTANQITVTPSAGTVTLSTPQDIATSSSPTFAALFLTAPKITAGSGTGLTVNDAGSIRVLNYTVTLTFAGLAAAALTADHVIATLPAKTKLIGIYADTTTKYVGGAVAAALLRVGKTTGGQEYVLDHDVFTAAVTKGLSDADLGTSINRANAVQGGDLPSWTATTDISVRITTVGANTDQLTQGSTTYYLTTISY